MDAYVVRVELRGDPPRDVYEKLHALMAENGFGQVIKGIHTVTKAPQESVLPHATYYGVLNLTTEVIRNQLVKQITEEIQPGIVMLVVRIQDAVYLKAKSPPRSQAHRLSAEPEPTTAEYRSLYGRGGQEYPRRSCGSP
jgi:hypothetical protein